MASGSRETPLTLVQFPFSAGIDEGTRDEVVEAGAGWLVLENGRQDQTGGYSTRAGFTALSTTLLDATTPTAGYRLIADGRTVLRICDGTAQVFDGVSSRWKSLGRVPEVDVRLRSLPTVAVNTGSTYAHSGDLAYCNGYLVNTWLATNLAASSADTLIAVTNAATGSVVRAPEAVGAASTMPGEPLLATYGNYVILIRSSAAATITAHYLDTTSAATITTGWVAFGASIATDMLNGPIAYAVQSLSDRVALAYVNNSAGVSQITVKTLTVAGGVLQTQALNTASVTPIHVAVCGSTSDTLWVTWDEATLIRAQGLSPSSITSTLATKATIITLPTGCLFVGIAQSATAGAARIIANDSSATTTARTRSVVTTAGAAVASGTECRVPFARCLQRPWQYAGRFYAVVSASPDQKTNTIVDWTDAVTYMRPVGVIDPGLCSESVCLLATTVVSATSSTLYMLATVTRSGAADATMLVEMDYASSRRWMPCAYGDSMFLSGGLLSYSDGVRVAEASFLYRPKVPTTTNGGTGITATTGWRYVCVFEEVDGDGNWHISGISTPSTITGAITNKTITVSTMPLSISARVNTLPATASGVRVAFYRTLDGGVAPYYRVGFTPNDTSVTAVTFADAVSDAVLAANAKLYEQPGVPGTAQDRRPPPGLSMLVVYNGCLVGATGSDVWYSGQNVSGEGAWFNPVFQVPVPGDGDITAIWVMDGTLFVSKRREIYAITGEAPSDNAATGGLGLPRRLAVDVGCIESRSICVTAFGTFFQSDRGIEILTRSQAVQWIGQPVQNTLAVCPIVTSATVDPGSACVLIELAAAESAGLVTSAGRTLVYDLSLQKWVSIDRRRNSAGATDAPSQSACMIYTGSAYRYAWLSAAGVVHYESTTSLDADGSPVCKRAVSANVRAAGFQGFQHVNKTLLLAKYLTPHDLSLSFAYDYSAVFKTARLYTSADLAAVTLVLPNMQLEHDMHDDARCEAVRVQLQEAPPSVGVGTFGIGQSATWIALTLEIVPQTGAYGLPDVSR